MTKKDGKIYVLISGGISVFFLFVINTQTPLGNVIMTITVLAIISIGIMGLILFDCVPNQRSLICKS